MANIWRVQVYPLRPWPSEPRLSEEKGLLVLNNEVLSERGLPGFYKFLLRAGFGTDTSLGEEGSTATDIEFALERFAQENIIYFESLSQIPDRLLVPEGAQP